MGILNEKSNKQAGFEVSIAVFGSICIICRIR